MGINQQDFLPILKLDKQYQVARKFQGYQKNILKSVIKLTWDKHPDKKMNEKEINKIIKDNFDYLKEYLSKYSRNFFLEILIQIFSYDISKEEKKYLQDYLGYLNEYRLENKKAIKTNLNSLEIKEPYLNIKQKVKNNLQNFIEDNLQLSLEIFPSANQCLDGLIDNYLRENIAILFK